MIKLRLTRMGRHKKPYYRLVAMDSRTKPQGGYISLLGNFDPLSDKVTLNEELILDYLKNGAQPTDTVRSILKDHKIWQKFVDSKKPKAKAKKSATAKPATAKKTAATKKPAAKKTTAKKPAVTKKSATDK